ADLNRERAAAGLPPIRNGIGLNTGQLTLGTIGGPERIKCGVIGDPVNLAARIESLTKAYDVALLVGEDTVAPLSAREAHRLRPVDRVRVVGRTRPVTLYEIFDADPRADAKGESLGDWNEAWQLYFQRRFADADALFARCAARLPGDRPAANFRQRCA